MQKARPVNLSWTLPFARVFGLPASVLRPSSSYEAARLCHQGSVVCRWCQAADHNISGGFEGSWTAPIGRGSVLHQQTESMNLQKCRIGNSVSEFPKELFGISSCG